MRKVVTVLAAAFIAVFAATTAQANIVAKINKSDQVMEVFVNGKLKHSWKVSTGKSGYETPSGKYRPQVMHAMHYSRKYDLTPMPYSIFFSGGFAIHGTAAVNRLGKPASHGCVRLDPHAAKELFKLVKTHGEKTTQIVISN